MLQNSDAKCEITKVIVQYTLRGRLLEFFLEVAEEGGFVGSCPAIGAYSQGDTIEAAILNMLEAIDVSA